MNLRFTDYSYHMVQVGNYTTHHHQATIEMQGSGNMRLDMPLPASIMAQIKEFYYEEAQKLLKEESCE